MSSDADASGLETTLERLAVETDTCTLAEFQEMATGLREDPGFKRWLLTGQALANENRLLTLALLRRRGSMCACEVQAALGCSNATVSHHMSCLIRADLVTSEKRGKWKHYELTSHGEHVTQEVVP